jgi:hypothetical protein
MRRLTFILLLVMLCFNGMLLWQSREKIPKNEHTCCFDLSRLDLRIDKTGASVFPGTPGLLY